MNTIPSKEQKIGHFTFRQILEGMEGVMIIIACYLTLFLKPLRDRWGLKKEDLNKTFPGDEIIAKPNNQFTHAIAIDAPREKVWCWVAQMGQGRGGFYSYEALENLTGLNIYNADRILPEFQNPKLGDLIPFGPNDAYPLVVCEPGKAMAIGLSFDMDKGTPFNPEVTPFPKNYFQLTWLWHVESVDAYHSRFYSRNRVVYNPSLKNKLMMGLLFESIVFAMDRKMCLGIKKRAEKLMKSEA